MRNLELIRSLKTNYNSVYKFLSRFHPTKQIIAQQVSQLFIKTETRLKEFFIRLVTSGEVIEI
ncbi:MAG: hypothetical protein C0168_10645 [Candidatus Aminicenantes bacterium]|nr:MAG: hypothetical protein C0168_10645 [Candidatus Aminicenantes bacterium]